MSIIARFIVDVPFGKKAQAFQVHEKYESFMRQAGFPKGRVLIGSIGVPESQVVEEYEFGSLAELEQVWSKLNVPQMAQFQEEMAPYIVPGSHRWEIYRVQD